MKISRSTTLPCTVNDAWEALHDPAVFQQVSQPFLRFTPVSPETFPLRFANKGHYLVKATACGLLPMGEQEINPVTRIVGDQRIFRDNGRGVRGMLGLVTTFTHTMTLEPSGKGPTLLRDHLEFSAGFATPFLAVGFRVFWWWRHLRMRQLAPEWHNPTTASWESRYDKKSWSGQVNPTLINHIETLTPGSALDVGAGEGADALWLAQRGWAVTALDASPRALARAETWRKRQVTKDRIDRRVRWIASDLVVENLPADPKKYDLVTCHFVHLPPGERAIVWKKLVQAVAPGGSLLIVGHSKKDLTTGIQRPPAELLFSASDLRAVIPSSFNSVTVTEMEREQTGPDGQTVTVSDLVLFASR